LRGLGHEYETWVVAKGVGALWQGRTHTIFERDVLPGFLSTRRWFPERSSPGVEARVETVIPLGS